MGHKLTVVILLFVKLIVFESFFLVAVVWIISTNTGATIIMHRSPMHPVTVLMCC